MENSVSSSLSSSTTTITAPPSYPAASFANLFLNEINYQDVTGLLDVQRSLLEQLDKSNEKLDNINRFSAKHYLDAQRDFDRHTHVLVTMKNDLDLIFKRIKQLKQRLSKKYPTAYSSVLQTTANPNDLLDDEDEDSTGSIASKIESK